MGIPMSYNDVNAIVAQAQPSSIHVTDSGLSQYYRKYLFQKALAVFEFSGAPDLWDMDFFRQCLFADGKLVVFRTPKYGIIPMNCTLSGLNLFYRPSGAIVANPLLPEVNLLTLGRDAELIYFQPNYESLMDIVAEYGDLMALTVETYAINLFNSKLSYVLTAGSKTAAEALKKGFDQALSGKPFVVFDKALMNDDGSPSWQLLLQNLKQNYIGTDLLNDLQSIEDRFNTTIGIPNANTQKRERLISAEVNANNSETKALASLWLDRIRDCLRRVNDRFGLNLSVDYRMKEENPIDSNTFSAGPLPG